MKYLTVILALVTLHALAEEKNLQDLQNLARQLHDIRTEAQANHDNWQRDKAVMQLRQQHLKQQEVQHKAQAERLRKQRELLQLQNGNLQQKQRKLQDNLAEQRKKLQEHLLELQAMAQRFPPIIREKTQRKIEAIRALDTSLDNLATQLKMTCELHQNIRQKAHELIRATIEIPELNATYDAAFLGYAWALAIAPDQSRAVIGFPGEKGWVWKDATAHLKPIRHFFQIISSQTPAQLVNLPLKLKLP